MTDESNDRKAATQVSIHQGDPMTEPNEREKKLAREHSLVTGDGEDDSGIAIGHLLARYRAELLKPENVLREAERLLREAAPPHVEFFGPRFWTDGTVNIVAGQHGGWTNHALWSSLAQAYAALVQSGKGE